MFIKNPLFNITGMFPRLMWNEKVVRKDMINY